MSQDKFVAFGHQQIQTLGHICPFQQLKVNVLSLNITLMKASRFVKQGVGEQNERRKLY